VKRTRRHGVLPAVNGRPLATFCGSYVMGAAAGVTFSPLAVVNACLLASGVLWLLWRRRSLPATTTLLILCAMWLGSAQGIRHAVQDAILWKTLPQGEAVTVLGEVVSEPVKRRNVWRFVFSRPKRTGSPKTVPHADLPVGGAAGRASGQSPRRREITARGQDTPSLSHRRVGGFVRGLPASARGGTHAPPISRSKAGRLRLACILFTPAPAIDSKPALPPALPAKGTSPPPSY
jgi:hypothetical protein